MFESCVEIRSHYSDYLDDLCSPEVRKSLRFHLKYCAVCREELEDWQSMQADLRALPRRRVSADLALCLRVRMSHEMSRRPLTELRIRLENLLKPLLIPATGGVLTAVISFCMIMGAGVPPATNIPDVPVDIVTPARVEALAPADFPTDENPVLLIDIDAKGRATGYRPISGQLSPELMQHLDRMIYFSAFQPATTFRGSFLGRASDGQVVLSLRRITVRG
jgi:hypothetical protein